MKNKLLIVFIALSGLICSYQFIRYINHVHVVAQFQELEPFKMRLPVYFKGYRLGHTGKIFPSKDYTSTNVELILNKHNLALPDNSTVKLRSKDKKDYIEFIYPNAPSLKILKNNSVIKGEKAVSISSYIDNQAESGGLDEIKENLNSTVQSAGLTFDALTELISTANLILEDMRSPLVESSKNLATATKNLANITEDLNNSIRPQKMENIISNIEGTTADIKLVTSNITDITRHMEIQTLSFFDCILKNVNTVILNINDIVIGFKSTLSKNFAGFRLAFGRLLK